MRILQRAAAVTGSLALAASGLVLAAAVPASATTTGLSCNAPSYFTGSGGHAGASIRCVGSAFTGRIVCYKPGYGNYTHYGNRVESGGTSTTWCDLGATIQKADGVPS
ncbi:hypothetical protein [Streptomyces sp. CB02056]|uniref:hypothetical protein n=1 Tax=Streptomyces sp. CB02056 TaxID=1703924 RepID=UPI00093E88C2|nr:hypothetical protein [Streptomyces sp. CB02056]OKI05801.1 hypothetical protein AMK13_21180 [Streptomyces sp. CB02056]